MQCLFLCLLLSDSPGESFFTLLFPVSFFIVLAPTPSHCAYSRFMYLYVIIHKYIAPKQGFIQRGGGGGGGGGNLGFPPLQQEFPPQNFGK